MYQISPFQHVSAALEPTNTSCLLELPTLFIQPLLCKAAHLRYIHACMWYLGSACNSNFISITLYYCQKKALNCSRHICHLTGVWLWRDVYVQTIHSTLALNLMGVQILALCTYLCLRVCLCCVLRYWIALHKYLQCFSMPDFNSCQNHWKRWGDGCTSIWAIFSFKSLVQGTFTLPLIHVHKLMHVNHAHPYTIYIIIYKYSYTPPLQTLNCHNAYNVYYQTHIA